MAASAQSRRVAGATLAGLIAATILLACVNPADTAWLPQCPIYEWTGLYCPGCGTTRMLYLLAHGHPLLALHENALSMLLLSLVIYVLVRQTAGKTAMPRVTLRQGIAVGFVVMLFAIARNLPMQPFRQLAPLPISALDLR
jgi:hypothetical protein